MKVIIRSYLDDEPKVLGTWTLDAERGICVCDNPNAEDCTLRARPINYDLRREVTPADGAAFLEALPYLYSGSAVRAELIR